MNEKNVCLELKNVSKQYKKNPQPVLEDINCKIYNGDFVGIIGKSGAGKTTLLNIIGLLTRPTSGDYYICGENLISEKKKAQYRNKKLGFVLQEYGLIDNYTVAENVQIPLDYAEIKNRKEEINNKIYRILKELGIESKMDVLCSELSGGQKQRVAIARALINNPDIIIADEPTGALDKETSKDFLKLMNKINKEMNKTIVMVTHDEKMLEGCNRVLQVKSGKLEELNRL